MKGHEGKGDCQGVHGHVVHACMERFAGLVHHLQSFRLFGCTLIYCT